METLLCAILVNKRKSEDIEMAEKLTKEDIAKIEAEIEHRKLVLRPQEHREISLKTLSTMLQSERRIKMRAASIISQE